MKRFLFVFFYLLLLAPKIHANLLPIESAFDFNIEAFENKTKITLSIADKYFVIKDSFKISTKDPNIVNENTALNYTYLSNNNSNDAKIFYRDKVEFLLPIKNTSNYDLFLQIDFQGCSDNKGCYPKNKETLILKNYNNNQKTLANVITNQTNNYANKSDELIPVDEAFKLELINVDDKSIKIIWLIAKDYYLYKDKISITTNGATISRATYPKAKIKNDIFFGDVNIYDKSFESLISFKNITNKNIAIKIAYQGCWDKGVCFPPQEKHYNIKPVNKKLVENITSIEKQKSLTSSTYNQISDTEINNQKIFKKNIFSLIIGAFIAGLFLALTPCVYPMIPILSSIIIGQNSFYKNIKAINISLVFVLSMATTYALIGAGAGYLGYGTNINAYIQTPFLIIPICILFIFFAFSMFGYYDIQISQNLQQKIEKINARQQSGNFFAVVIMGVLSALIVSPCITPFIATSLTYIVIEGSPLKGTIGLFAMGIGMGVPLIIICSLGVKIMPKSGIWMQKIKNIFGFLILGVAIYLLDRIASDLISITLWATLFTFAAINLGVISPIKLANFWQLLFKLITIIVLLYGFLLWFFIAKGNYSYHPLYDFKYLFNKPYEQKTEFIVTKSNKDLNSLLFEAQENNKIVVLKFDAEWCISCKIMEKGLFANAEVVKKLKNTANIVADVTKNTNNNKNLLDRFNLVGPPAILFFKNQQELRDKRIIGEIKAQDFLEIFNKI